MGQADGVAAGRHRTLPEAGFGDTGLGPGPGSATWDATHAANADTRQSRSAYVDIEDDVRPAQPWMRRFRVETFTRIVLPKHRPPPPRDKLARSIATMTELGAFVHELRSGLEIRQADLAARAGVGRQWIVALEQGKQSLEAGKVLRTLEALGFELVLTPYAPPPPWMLRAVRAAHETRQAKAEARRARRNTRRERARAARLAENAVRGAVDLD
jgi:y4mF family transcriptional regulator